MASFEPERRPSAASPERARAVGSPPLPLLNHVKFNLCDSAPYYPQRFTGRIRHVHNAAWYVGASVIDTNCYGPSGGDIRHPQSGSKGERPVSGGQCLRIELLAIRSRLFLRVKASNSARCELCLDRAR